MSDELHTTRSDRAQYLAGLRNEVMKAVVRYQHECGITIEEGVASLDMVKALLLQDWLDQGDEEDDDDEETVQET